MENGLDLQDNMKYCTGCEACVSICPMNAISMKTNVEGFFYPEIDLTTCDECGMCRDCCPALNPVYQNIETPDCYAAIAKDEIRYGCSSGGAFHVFANYVLNQGGYVSAAAYNDNFEVEHVVISDSNELYRLQKSKYVQSRIGTVFSKIKKLLSENHLVLFVGCPCQVAGLHAYLGCKNENLIAIDLVCHGVPSPLVWRQYLDEVHKDKSIVDVDFRNKKFGWNAEIITVSYLDGTFYEQDRNHDAYESGFHSNLFLRNSCGDCPFCRYPRQGDVSLADFWAIERCNPILNDGKGTSMVLLNTYTGRKFFEKVKEEFPVCERMPLEATIYNRLYPKINVHPARERFFDLLQRHGLVKASEYALHNKYDVGIVGIWSERNYGSEITYYALYEFIRAKGLEPLMIERPSEVPWPPNKTPVLFKDNPYQIYDLCPLFHTKSEMYQLNQQCDTFIIGSDQMWHHDLYESFGKISYLDFINNGQKKLSYATSFGREYWTGNENARAKVAYDLAKFSAVSVRESSGVELCKNLFQTDAQWVLDPVFLCDNSIYIQLAQKSTLDISMECLGAYILDISPVKQEVLNYAGNLLGLRLSTISDAAKPQYEKIPEVKYDVCVEDWLKNIIESKFVITDSFHGMCFAILFKKPFIAIANQGRGVERFTSLLKLLHLENRSVSDFNEIMDHPALIKAIDYTAVYKILTRKKKESAEWLNRELARQRDKALTDIDIMDSRLGELEMQIYTQEEKLRSFVDAKQFDELAGNVIRHEKMLIPHGEMIQKLEAHKVEETRFDELVANVIRHEEMLVCLEASDLNGRLTNLEEQLASSKGDLNEIKSSISYKLGRMLTFIPRKLRSHFRDTR
jgi:coenzyme F420-reducing hydrogenase beta subunit